MENLKKYNFKEFDENGNIVKSISANNLNELSEKTNITKTKLNRLSLGYYRNKKNQSKEFTKKYTLTMNYDIHRNYGKEKIKLNSLKIHDEKTGDEKYFKNKKELCEFLNTSKYHIRKAIKNKTTLSNYYITSIKENNKI